MCLCRSVRSVVHVLLLFLLFSGGGAYRLKGRGGEKIAGLCRSLLLIFHSVVFSTRKRYAFGTEHNLTYYSYYLSLLLFVVIEVSVYCSYFQVFTVITLFEFVGKKELDGI